MGEPASFTAGDYLSWIRPYDQCVFRDSSGDDNYLKASTCTLTYYLSNDNARLEIVATSTGDDYSVSVPSTTCQTYQPGTYYWAAVITHSTAGAVKQWTVGRGEMEILENFANGGVVGYDGRSHVRRVLEALRLAVEGRAEKATLDWVSLTIAGRARAADPRELRAWLAQYEALYQQEQDDLKISRGEDPGNRILVRL